MMCLVMIRDMGKVVMLATICDDGIEEVCDRIAVVRGRRVEWTGEEDSEERNKRLVVRIVESKDIGVSGDREGKKVDSVFNRVFNECEESRTGISPVVERREGSTVFDGSFSSDQIDEKLEMLNEATKRGEIGGYEVSYGRFEDDRFPVTIDLDISSYDTKNK